MLYTHWMSNPSSTRTLPTPLMAAVCSVVLSTVYTAPSGKESDKDITILVSPIVYPFWRSDNITVSTGEGELV